MLGEINSIYGNHSVKVREWSAGEGYVTTYHDGSQGDIHINKKTLLDREFGMRVLSYLHEASHKYAKTHDYGERGYCDGNGNYKVQGLTFQEACNNADSYAWYIWQAASRIVEKTSQKKISLAGALGNRPDLLI